mmetsp:Transcript_5268/g.12903  ORF Transcript_5268/g.12903 Transcript_5268/m.12903 type:complete len:417 (+) Transcript_5268:248-1498(+)
MCFATTDILAAAAATATAAAAAAAGDGCGGGQARLPELVGELELTLVTALDALRRVVADRGRGAEVAAMRHSRQELAADGLVEHLWTALAMSGSSEGEVLNEEMSTACLQRASARRSRAARAARAIEEVGQREALLQAARRQVQETETEVDTLRAASLSLLELHSSHVEDVESVSVSGAALFSAMGRRGALRAKLRGYIEEPQALECRFKDGLSEIDAEWSGQFQGRAAAHAVDVRHEEAMFRTEGDEMHAEVEAARAAEVQSMQLAERRASELRARVDQSCTTLSARRELCEKLSEECEEAEEEEVEGRAELQAAEISLGEAQARRTRRLEVLRRRRYELEWEHELELASAQRSSNTKVVEKRSLLQSSLTSISAPDNDDMVELDGSSWLDSAGLAAAVEFAERAKLRLSSYLPT